MYYIYNNIFIFSKSQNKNMSKSLAYNAVKNLATQLRKPLENEKRLWRGSNTQFWNDRLNNYQLELETRNASILLLQQIRQRPEKIRNQQRTKLFKNELEQKQKIIQSKKINTLLSENKFNEITKKVIKNNIFLSLVQATSFWNKIQAKGRHTLTLTNKNGNSTIVALNDTTKNYIIKIIMGDWMNELATDYSDGMAEYHIENIEKIDINLYIEPKKIIKNKDGNFFGYINTTDIDLSKYQIFNQYQAYDNTMIENREQCLLHTLNQYGISKAVINQIKMAITIENINCSIKKTDLKKIAIMIGRNIILHTIKNTSSNSSNQIFKCDTSILPDIEIALYQNHYFKYEITDYSKFSIVNYKDVRTLDNFNEITKFQKNITYDRTPGKYKINSLLMVHKLFEDNYFKKLDLSKFEETQTKVQKGEIYLDNIDDEQKPYLIKNKIITNKKIYIADIETYVNDETHKLQLIGLSNYDNDIVVIMNVCDEIFINETISKEQMIVNKWLNLMTNNGKNDALCYYHNVKYDYTILEPYINITEKCEKNNILYSVKITHRNRTIELRDSYKILPFALKKFQKEFNLDEQYKKKEAINYTYYTVENNNKRINISEYTKNLSIKEQSIFLKNIQNEPSYDKLTNTFNPMEYYMEYLRLDCLVLKKGIQKFDSLIKEITKNKTSIYDYLTISSLTDKFMTLEGAYENIYEVKGNLRAYIAKAVYGGRVCVNNKYIKKTINKKISDYDGVSLYPSAINRLSREIGLPIGKCKRLVNFEDWEKLTYSILTVKILKVNKIQQMPFIAHKTDTSILYSNEPPKDDIIIDSITLQDYIKFHEIEYEIKDGVYWNEGGNKKMGDIIQSLFETRLKYKSSNEALANTIKLMLNSSYGKTIMKKTHVEKKIIKSNKNVYDENSKTWIKEENKLFDSYVYNNFNTIRKYRRINDNNIEIEKICIDDSYNRGHIGCAILSMSKRIMNEVFDVANEKEYPIYYTDTDSIHMNFDDVPLLEKAYNEKYNKILNGKNLEQFHTDFKLKKAVGEIYSIKSIFLGKKSYIDCLESTDKDGNIIHDEHYRLKGITAEGLENSSKEYNNGYLGLYEDLASGTKKKIILNPFNKEKNKNKVLFEFKAGKVNTKREFTREVQF